MSDDKVRTEEEENSEIEETEEENSSAGFLYQERLPELEPKSFAEGFTPRTILGALFVAIIMLPGSIYLSLMMGQDLGPAAEWTTIILFVEVARRSLTILRRQEIYLIFYLAGSIGLAGGSFYWLVWNQYLRQSPAAKMFGIAESADPKMMIPTFASPPLGSTAYVERTLLHHDWLIPIFLIVAMSLLQRVQWIGMGYFLFRTTSDVERLPFPMAPVAAQGATALAEVSQEKETWRWAVFSTGTIVGLLYGFFYVGVPILTGAFLAEPEYLIPMPFADLTLNSETIFPTGRIGITTDLRFILMGFVLPFPIVVGGFISSAFANFVFSPLLYRWGIAHNHNFFPNWRRGMNLIQTEVATGFDLWISVGIGISLAVALIGIAKVIKNVLMSRKRSTDGQRTLSSLLPKGRGDFPLPLALGAWALATMVQVVICRWLVPDFPLWIIVIFAFIWTPLISYVSARIIGMTGQPIQIPYMAQAAFILSGYKGVDIWFAPVPMFDHGWAAQRFREVELTGTKFTSIIKAEAFTLFVVLFFSFIYWAFFWRLSPIPSSQYPWAQVYWPLQAFYQCLWATGTMEGGANYLLQAVKFEVIGAAMGGSVLFYWLTTLLGLHYTWFYGILLGFTWNITNHIPMFIGALLGRYYMARRFGLRKWQLYTPVLLAGYACGVGLVGMFCVAIAIVLKSVRSQAF